MRRVMVGALTVLLAMPVPALAQNEGAAEIIVTAQRRASEDYAPTMPAVGLRRSADFAVQEVTISGDTRDAERRASEIYEMVRGAILAAPAHGIVLAYGSSVLTKLTLDNYRALALAKDNRPDSSKIMFLAKARLGAGTDLRDAQARITSYIKTVTPVGRAQIETSDDLTLSVVAPDQYRGAIIDAVSKDARAVAAQVGDGYGVQIDGLNQPVEWARAGLGEVLLYIPYRLTILPRK